MRTITLHGALGERFGGPYDLEVASAAEAARALGTQLPGFMDDIGAGEFVLVRGDLPGGMALDEDNLRFGLGRADLHFIPVALGSKRQGIGKVILGIAITAAAFLAAPTTGGTSLSIAMKESIGTGLIFGNITYGDIAKFGVALALSGIAQMLTRTPKVHDFAPPDQKQSFLFNRAVNVSHQGAAVPLVYGRTRVGSVVVSSGLQPEE